MTRIASLNVLLETTGKDYLREVYGGVVRNMQKTGISYILKNQNLSGTPGGGTYEAKRFQNRASSAYGTARSAAEGTKVKVKPVVISVDQDKELITEVEAKDVSLYGVDNFIARQVESDRLSMLRELETAFFTCAKTKGTKLTLTATAPEERAEALIQAVETVKNNYVDGVNRDMIALVCAPAYFGKLRTYLDKVNDGGAMGEEITTFHGVNTYSSVYLPAGLDAIVMAQGSIAQPVLANIIEPERIQLSNAISTGLFFSYGTEAVTPDLIFYAETPTVTPGTEGNGDK